MGTGRTAVPRVTAPSGRVPLGVSVPRVTVRSGPRLPVATGRTAVRRVSVRSGLGLREVTGRTAVPQGERPQRSGAPRGDWQDRRPQGDRPQRASAPRGERPQGDRPQRSAAARGDWQDRRPQGDRPRPATVRVATVASGATAVRRVTAPAVTVPSGRTAVRRVTAPPATVRARRGQWGDRRPQGDRPSGDRPRPGMTGQGATAVRRVTAPAVTVPSGRTAVRRVTAPAGDRPSGRTAVRRGTAPPGIVPSGRTAVRRGTGHSGGGGSRGSWQDRRPSGDRQGRPAGRPGAEREDRRPPLPPGPAIPEWVDNRDLDPAVRGALRGLDPRNAERVAAHLVAAGNLVDEDPDAALAHARAARDRASRVAAVREAVGVAAYHAGDFAEAAREIRAYRRMSGDQGYRAVLADCERALGVPTSRCGSSRRRSRTAPTRTKLLELRIVEAGARRDLGEDAAARLVLETALGVRADPAGLDASDPARVRLAAAYAECCRRRARRSSRAGGSPPIAAADPENLTGAVDVSGSSSSTSRRSSRCMTRTGEAPADSHLEVEGTVAGSDVPEVVEELPEDTPRPRAELRRRGRGRGRRAARGDPTPPGHRTTRAGRTTGSTEL